MGQKSGWLTAKALGLTWPPAKCPVGGSVWAAGEKREHALMRSSLAALNPRVSATFSPSRASRAAPPGSRASAGIRAKNQTETASFSGLWPRVAFSAEQNPQGARLGKIRSFLCQRDSPSRC